MVYEFRSLQFGAKTKRYVFIYYKGRVSAKKRKEEKETGYHNKE